MRGRTAPVVAAVLVLLMTAVAAGWHFRYSFAETHDVPGIHDCWGFSRHPEECR